MHRFARAVPPRRRRAVREYLRSARRQVPDTSRQLQVCRRPQLERLLRALPRDGLPYLRDRMIMLLLYFGALTTFGLLGLQIEELRFVDGALVLRGIGRRREHRVIGRGNQQLCPVRAVQDWLAASALHSGPLVRGLGGHRLGNLRSGKDSIQPGRYRQSALWELVRTWYTRAGLPAEGAACLSFRYGFLLDAYDAGVRPAELADHFGYAETRHVLHRIQLLGHPLKAAQDDAPRRRVRSVAWKAGYRPKGP